MTREAIDFFKKIISETERVLKDRPEMLREVETVLPYYRMAIEALQERPKGRWSKNIQSIGGRYITYYKCSTCGKSVLFGELDFCPNCGADMRESEQ